MLENLIKKAKYVALAGLTALTLNCDNGTSNSVQCDANSDCQSGYQCIANKCELMPENKAPIANAGSDQPSNFDKNCFDSNLYNNNGLCPSGYNIENNLHPGNKVTLDGTLSSDPEGKALQYLWRQISGPSAVLSNNGVVKPYFTPSQVGDYSFGLEVSDGVKESTEDSVNVGIRDNLGPIADAGNILSVPKNTTFVIDATNSTDSDGSIALYELDLEGDGNYEVSNVSGTFNILGGYPIDACLYSTVRITDNDGAKDTAIDCIPVGSGTCPNPCP